MTQPKPVVRARSGAGERSARRVPTGAAAALHAVEGRASQSAARESALQSPSGQPPSQPIQFTPARTPAPAPQAPPAAPQPPPCRRGDADRRQAEARDRAFRHARRPAARRARARLQLVAERRPLCLDRQRLCRRRQGADHAATSPARSSPCTSIEGQHVKVGDPLFDIDPAPYETALALAKGRLEAAKVEFANLRDPTFRATSTRSRWARNAVKLRQADFDRKKTLAPATPARPSTSDTSAAALVQAKQILEFVKSQQETAKVKLGGGPDTPIEKFPDYMQAKAGGRRRRAQPRLHPRQGADRRRRDAGRQHRARPRRAGRPGRCSPSSPTYGPLGRRQSEGIRPDLRHAGPAGDGDGRHVPGPRMERERLLDRARHRRAIRDPAAAERQRQLGQGRAAHAAALLLRRRSGRYDGPARRA